MNSESILIDALGAPRQSGGMQLVAFEVLYAWNEEFPQDEVTVIGPKWLKQELLNSGFIFNFFVWPNSHFAWRAFGQFLVTPIVKIFSRSSKVLALNAVISPFLPAPVTTVVCHDWRHLKRPDEFSRMQLFYRRLWKRSGEVAGKVVAISNKTLIESQEILHRKDINLIPLGSDHPVRWGVDRENRDSRGITIVTFGHHPNKRPLLVVEAFIKSLEMKLLAPGSRLVVFGVDKQSLFADSKMNISKYGDSIVATGYVSEKEYRAIFSHSDLIILASTDEGFGIPVVEAQYFGIPCLTTLDSGLSEIHPSKVLSVEPDSLSLARGIAESLTGENPKYSAENLRTWSEVTKEIRSVVFSI